MTESRIKYALHHGHWTYGEDAPTRLQAEATMVLVSEYTSSMDGKLFCPVCFTHLTRAPKEKSLFSNGRKACFAHLPRFSDVECDLRSTKPEGKKYATEEEAREAIAREELVVVSAFQSDVPDSAGLNSGVYDQSRVEDSAGPESEVAIGRHRGDKFKVPTRIATVAAICRSFEINLYRYYLFPGSTTAVRLIDALMDISSVNQTESVPRLYFGRITSTRNAGINPKPTNTRMTWLKHHPDVKDFCLKDVDWIQRDRGINDQSTGRTVIIWGTVTESGIGLCINRPGWGGYALLPEKYDALLP